ncbi:CPBP family intramembrane glutamic endopeptidase [Natribacillus halophilus]|uniref:CAAX prenyl protease 2/Lysostaphin resistance protein A-like domain-containing protein n=1 Tax=Natribacillus halophilus TaxID=549003 RepID=A0A1G8PG28_9BACI|nr:type II CAAX endopeptidase family protein [Natribacillus halophilus]SDI91484.1 hypothetical protein SAMN04488123_108126 [Natribacillus halophilus]
MSLRYWLVIVTFIAVQLLGGLLALPLMAFGFSWDTATTTAIIISFTIGLIVIWFLIRKEPDPLRSKQAPLNAGLSILLVIGGFFVALIAQVVIIEFQSSVLGIQPESENTELILDIMSENIWMIVTVALIGPIIEEIVFRQAIFGHLYRKMNFFWAGLISSVIFAVIHLDFSHMLVYMVLGFLFAYLYALSKRIIVPILAHVLMNAFASLPVLLGIDPEDVEQMEESLQMITGLLGALIP